MVKLNLSNKNDKDGFAVLHRYWGWSSDYGDSDYTDMYFDEDNQPHLWDYVRSQNEITLNESELDALLMAYRELQKNYEFLADIPDFIGRTDALRNTDRFVTEKLKKLETMYARKTNAPKKYNSVRKLENSVRRMF